MGSDQQISLLDDLKSRALVNPQRAPGKMAATSNPGTAMESNSMVWYDYLEVVVLVVSCVLGLVGNLTVLKISIRIRTFSKQICLLFCGILFADILICATRIPASVFLILSDSRTGSVAATANNSFVAAVAAAATALTTPTTLTSGSVDLEGSSLTNAESSPSGMSGMPGVKAEGDGQPGGMSRMSDHESLADIDIACEVWSASSAILLTVVWLHLVVGVQRLAIIYAFSKYRKIFTQTFIGVFVLGGWLLGLVAIYTPLRVLGKPVERAGRGACRVGTDTPDNVLIARSLTTATLCLLPLLIAMGCYVVIMRSVWKAKRVRTEAASEYNRVIAVTFFRIISLVFTYVPVCLAAMVEVRGVEVPDAVHRYLGHLLWLQSVLSPFVTLQDHDFREKIMMPKHVNGTLGEQEVQPNGVMPDIGSSGGQDGEEHRARNLAEMKREVRRSRLQRGLSFITSADMRTMRGSSE